MEIETHDRIGGSYFSETSAGPFGARRVDDRRRWMAWDRIGWGSTTIWQGVMDDFGTLVETRN